MLRGRWPILIMVCALQALALWGTSRLPGFGAQGWHHVASLVAVLALTLWLRRPLTRSRRVLAIGVLATSVLAGASGFWLLYWKEGIRAAGYQDWGVWWHVAWSWTGSVFFFQHTWINRVSFAHFVRRSLARLDAAIVHIGAYLLVVAMFILTWSGVGKGWFTVESYIPLTLYAWLVATTPPYALWVVARFAPVGGWRSRLDRAHLRGPVDLALVPAAALATLSGIPLTWFDPIMDEHGWKYVSKFWHVWPSVLFLVLVFVHSVHSWNGMRAHWRKVGVSLGDLATPVRAPQPPQDG